MFVQQVPKKLPGEGCGTVKVNIEFGTEEEKESVSLSSLSTVPTLGNDETEQWAVKQQGKERDRTQTPQKKTAREGREKPRKKRE